MPLSVSGRAAIDVVKELTQDATKVFVETIDSPMESESKGRGNVVTEIDYLIEKRSIELLKKEYPTFHILSEKKERLWALPITRGYWIQLTERGISCQGCQFFRLLLL